MRFEEYILERTANHPSLVPMIMDGQGKASFRLACKETLEHSNFSSWLNQSALDGPERVLIDEQIYTPWHRGNEPLKQLFDRLCEEGANSFPMGWSGIATAPEGTGLSGVLSARDAGPINFPRPPGIAWGSIRFPQ